jgi:UDP-3-O-[3-hydroxymyristoyl] glucosamine N-acyltransferase
MKLTLADVARLTGGQAFGDPGMVLTGVAGIEEAGRGDLTFAKEDALDRVPACRASAVIVPSRVEAKPAQVVVKDPHLAFVRVLEVVEKERAWVPKGVHARAVLDEGAQLGPDAAVGPGAVIGSRSRIGARTLVHANATIGPDCVIGDDCVIHPGVVLRERVVIGNRTIIHANTTLGGDGFGYLQVEGRQVKVPQVGGVRIGDDVEIGCNCTVDRGATGDTAIGNGVKIDNHSHIAHNCRIGDHCILVAYARLGGSVVLGRNVILAEDVGVTDHVTLGDGCIVTATARVSKSWPAGSVIGGTPAVEFERLKRSIVLQRKLPQIYRDLQEVRRHLGIGVTESAGET